MRPDELERRLRQRLDALGPAPGAELLHVLMLPDFERADRIGEFWGYTESRTFAELLIDCEEDQTLRAVPVGMLREAERDADRALSQSSVGKHSGTASAQRRLAMWIETKANGEYLNADMIERVTVEDTTLTAHIPSGGSVVISTHRSAEEGVDALTTRTGGVE
jgi:hypothetical protein